MDGRLLAPHSAQGSAPAKALPWWMWILAAIAIFVLSQLSVLVTPQGGSVAAWWPAAGVSVLCSRLKDAHHILTSIDGPHDNVIVIKPPMCFSRANVDTLVGGMLEVLRKDLEADMRSVGCASVAEIDRRVLAPPPSPLSPSSSLS